jgi:hypothetical protein
MGFCFDSPGWKIVHCCRSCDKDLNASKLIDPAIRCSRESLNIAEPGNLEAWRPEQIVRVMGDGREIRPV